ncbi:MAG: DNA polymerase III subunit alpha [Anaerolineae bacterium]
MSYPHLHVHSYNTLLGATPSPEALAARAADEGLTHLALTDTNALYGAVAFDRACRAAGVQPILGLAVRVAWPADLEPLPPHRDTPQQPGLLILLAHAPAGYTSLCRLSTRIQGHADREERARQGLALEDLRASGDGLLCLTGGRRGWAERAVRAGEINLAHRFIGKLCGIYGPQQTFVSLELHTPADRAVAGALDERANLLGLNSVAVQPIYALEPDEHARLQLLAAIAHNCPIGEVPADALPDAGVRRVDLHWLGPRELATRFADFPKALAQTQVIAERCTSVLPDGTLRWPTLDLPDGQTPEAVLREQAPAGCRRRYAPGAHDALPDAIRQRLDQELVAIVEHGYAPLFLVVADIVRYARARDIPVSTRGSVANSLVAYALRITTVDPVVHGLLFERFLSPGRSDPPDIDLDFCSRRRDEVLAYIRRTYGEDRVALVGAMSTLRLRSAARETAKAYELDAQQTRKLIAALPDRRHPREGPTPSQEEVIAGLGDPWLQDAARATYSIAGFPHHLSIHAAGLVITPGPLTDLLPVQMAPKGYLTTQYNHGDTEAIGLPKLDLLGIRALTVLADAAERIRQEAARTAKPTSAPDAEDARARGARENQAGYGAAAPSRDFRLDDIPPDDPATGDLLARGDTVGVFQCDSVGARRTLRKLKARTVQDLAVANAFFKPGPATGGQADLFVRRYRGEADTHYLHPALIPILAPTKGVLIFQEQVLRVATEIAGLSWAQADHIRRGMSKMQPEEMSRLQTVFVEGCQRPGGPGLDASRAAQLWEQVAAFSGYGFNQGHATAYADVSYRSAYMKAHHPAAFFWARLRNYGGYHHPAVYMAEAMKLGIEVRPPHVNHSEAGVTLHTSPMRQTKDVDGARVSVPEARAEARTGNRPVLWLGLGLVRELRRRAVSDLVAAREMGPFTGLRDLLLRVELHPKETIHLIRCGALDGLGRNRPTLVIEAQEIERAGTARQMTFDFGVPEAPPATFAQRLAWERHLLGYPIDVLRDWIPVLRGQRAVPATLADLPRIRGQAEVVAVRLPGWHRRGFALWDGDSWCMAVTEGSRAWPPTWTPAVLRGHWRSDRWGMGWLATDNWDKITDEQD